MSTKQTSKMELNVNTKASVALFVIKGKIGWDYARQLDEEINRVISEGFTHIVLNLDEVSFLCSGGIGALVYHMKRVQEKGGDIYIVSSSDYIQYLFATIGFNIVFQGKIFESFDKFSERILGPKELSLNFEPPVPFGEDESRENASHLSDDPEKDWSEVSSESRGR